MEQLINNDFMPCTNIKINERCLMFLFTPIHHISSCKRAWAYSYYVGHRTIGVRKYKSQHGDGKIKAIMQRWLVLHETGGVTESRLNPKLLKCSIPTSIFKHTQFKSSQAPTRLEFQVKHVLKYLSRVDLALKLFTGPLCIYVYAIWVYIAI